MKIAKCSVKSLVESLSEHDILISDELSKLGSSTLVIFKGVCMYTCINNQKIDSMGRNMWPHCCCVVATEWFCTIWQLVSMVTALIKCVHMPYLTAHCSSLTISHINAFLMYIYHKSFKMVVPNTFYMPSCGQLYDFIFRKWVAVK